LLLLVLGGVSVAQDPVAPAVGGCNVVTSLPDVDDAGEFARPPATLEDCAAAEALVEEFLAMSRGDFQRVDLIEDIPGNVSVYVGSMTPWGGPASALPTNRRHGVTWLSGRIVVVVTEGSDFAGPTTMVVIADLETRQVCEFARWPGAADPRSLSVQEIQDVLDAGLIGDQATPACRLGSLPID
jgi:hypothetical protein